VAGGVRHAEHRVEKRDHELNPYFIKEQEQQQEEAKEEKQGGKAWWTTGDNGDGEGAEEEQSKSVYSAEEETALETMKASEEMTNDERDDLYYSLEDAYLPIWYDRGTGWEGTTYQEAVDFCKAHDEFVPCPYHVYCPTLGNLIFDEVMEEEGRSWAPIRDTWDGWVFVGKGEMKCETYSGRPGAAGHKSGQGRPDDAHDDYDDVESTRRHIMCCLDALDDGMVELTPKLPAPPDVEREHGEGVDDPIPPPPLGPSNVVTNNAGPALAFHDDGSGAGLDEYIHENYGPHWFDYNDGWDGSTYAAGEAFCNSLTLTLCPIKAVCPNGRDAIKPLTYEMDSFGISPQWTPVSNSENAWIMVGKISDLERSTCMTFHELYNHDPSWGRDGSDTRLKEHIICCSGDPDSSPEHNIDEPGSQTPMHGMPTAQIEPTEFVSGAREDHNGAGNSSPHAGEHSHEDHINDMKKALNPAWFSIEDGIGWSGGSHTDALNFCHDIDKELCPNAAVCPNGPTHPAFENPQFTAGTGATHQWAPTVNRPNSWVLIDTLEENLSTQCMDYEQLNGNESPQWGLDQSMQELKHHILCCKKTSHTQVQEDTISASVQSPILPTQASYEEIDKEPTLYIAGTWFHAENGWNGGSHDDATHFCALKEINRKQMELCPYHMYCPQGPSRPSAESNGNIIGEGEESEQWAPSSGGDNQWVMVGMHGHNKATQCLTHTQLNGPAPSWGHDENNQEKKHHIMCCTRE